jgi:hypothetical protein
MRRLSIRASIALSACILSGCHLMESMAVEDLVKRLNEQAFAQNAEVKIAFDPEKETIITDSAPYLVRRYQMNVAYRKEDTRDDEPKRYDSFRTVHYPGCSKPSAETEFNYILDSLMNSGVCDLHIFNEAPPPSALSIIETAQTIEVEGHTIRRLNLTIKRPDGRSAVLVFYPYRSDIPQEVAPLIASALGLRPLSTNFTGMPGPDEVDRLIASATAKSNSSKYVWLDMLAQRDPPSDENLSADRFEPTEIAKRGEALTRRFEAMAPQADKQNYWGFVGQLLARLPQQDWALYRDRIAAAMMSAPREGVATQIKLIHRMTDMGASAGQVLARAYSVEGNKSEITIAACRIGAPGAPHLGKALLASWKTSNSPQLVDFRPSRRHRWTNKIIWDPIARERWERCTEDGKKHGPPENITFSACWAIPDTTPEASPTYLALRRMGLGAEADATMTHNYSIHWKKTYASIGPNSPAKVCGESELM